jgi:hypothetical protein
MDALNMFDEKTDQPQCLKAGVAAGDKGADLIGSFMTFFRSFYDGKPWDAKVGGCIQVESARFQPILPIA